MTNIMRALSKIENNMDIINRLFEIHSSFYKDYNESKITSTKNKYSQILDHLRSMHPNYKGKKYTLIVTYSIDDLDEDFNNKDWFLCSCLFENKDLDKLIFNNKLYKLKEEDCTINNIDKVFDIASSISDIIPTIYDYHYDKWNTTLTFNINPHNVREFGLETILAEYLWNITFYGFDEETIQKGANRIIEETKEIVHKLKKESPFKDNNANINNKDNDIIIANDEDSIEDIVNNKPIDLEEFNDTDKYNIMKLKGIIGALSLYKDLVYYFIFRK